MIEYEGLSEVTLLVNGNNHTVAVWPHETLLHVLREKLHLSGTKSGCENGDCGACTVLIDGEPFKSCIYLAVEAVEHSICTVEGLKNTPIQQAFVSEGGFQCGFCTAGFLLNAHSLLEKYPQADDELKKEWLSSNLCRCTGYEGIRDALNEAQKIQSKGK